MRHCAFVWCFCIDYEVASFLAHFWKELMDSFMFFFGMLESKD